MRMTAQRARQAEQVEPAEPMQKSRAGDGNALAAEQAQTGAPRGDDPPVKGTVFPCREMHPEDVPACAAIEAAVSDGWSAGALAEELSQPTARLFVAEAYSGTVPGTQVNKTISILFDSDRPSGANSAETSNAQLPDAKALYTQTPSTQIAALAVFQLVCEEASLYTVSTAPALRRQGAARALLQYAFAQLAAQGAQTVFLEVRAQNEAARALYAALGFEETGTRRGFYTKPNDDAVLMRKTIHNS